MNLILGTANFDNKYGVNSTKNPSTKQIKNIFDFCDKRINFLDCAENYSLNLNNKYIKKFELILKIKFNHKKKKISKEDLLNKIVSLIKKNKLDYVHTLMFHRSSDIFKMNKSDLEYSINFLKKKICKKVGISIYDPSELKRIYRYFKPDVVQCPLNLFDSRIYDTGWMSKIKERGAEIHVRSVFLQGLLLSNKENLSKKFLKYLNFFKKLEKFSARIHKSKLQICLNNIKYYKKKIDYLVIGVQNLKQLEEIYFFYNKKNKFEFIEFKNVPKKLYDPRLW
jgi:aryl-alcohol dehydrogenase-like predicted oxidoreductase